jgi:hypothetical protein
MKTYFDVHLFIHYVHIISHNATLNQEHFVGKLFLIYNVNVQASCCHVIMLICPVDTVNPEKNIRKCLITVDATRTKKQIRL